MRIGRNLFSGAVLAAAGATVSLAATDAIDIGSQRELFLDDRLVASFDGTALVSGRPRDEGEVFRFDQPWEGNVSLHATVLQDGGRYLLYYRGWQVDLPTEVGQKQEVVGVVTCVAESLDGIHWRRPSLGLHEFNGSRDNNIILVADDSRVTTNFMPFIDRRPGVPWEERFKAIGGQRHQGAYRLVSADGIHWRKLPLPPLFKGYALDSPNVVFWFEAEQQYVMYLRTWSKGGTPDQPELEGIRTISRATSADFVHWTEPVPMSFGDTPLEHLYTNNTQPYFRAPQQLVALPARFLPERRVLPDEELAARQVHPSQHEGVSDVVLMSSRGGTTFDRTFMTAFLRPGRDRGNWSARNNYPARGVVRTGPDEMSIYVDSNYAQPDNHLRRHSLRLDGFSSLHADYASGQATTHPITFAGSRLVLNYATSAAGEVRVALLDADGSPLPGFAAEDCDPVIGDEIDRTVSWKGDADVSSLVGRPVRLRLHLQDADLYSIQFTD